LLDQPDDFELLSGRVPHSCLPLAIVLGPMADNGSPPVMLFGVVQALRNALAPAKLGDAVLAVQPGEDDPDLLLGRMQLPGRPADVLHDLLGGGFLRHGFLAYPHSLRVTMSQNPPLLNHHKPSHGP
jgi:hypothetical protein